MSTGELPRQPLAVVIAGPNGAGKTTAAPRLLLGALAVGEFVNADPIAQGLSYFQPETVAIAAGRAMVARLKALAQARQDFAFETTLAAQSYAPWLKGLRSRGYRVHLVFLSLPSPNMAVARVAERVRSGGHAVPEATIRRRFTAGLRSFFATYRHLVDSWQLFDNAELSGPRLIAASRPGEEERILDNDAWQRLLENVR